MAARPLPPHPRPHVWVNCASSADGRLAFARGERAHLSGPEDLARVHRLRATSDAILVGVGTVVHDDPSLHVKWELAGEPRGRSPMRVVVDASGRLPDRARLLDGSAPTMVATTERNHRRYPESVRTVVAGRETVDLARLFALLRDEGVERLMVEGGARILASVLRGGLFDRWTIYYAPVVIGGQTAPPVVEGDEAFGPADLVSLTLDRLEPLGAGYVATYGPRAPLDGGPAAP
jgi:2,5-diamino-6-(ribosylamino)-4(3H)-pyrimidinone 5'-phosphate reductase